jgi:choloylglycine hydrolase
MLRPTILLVLCGLAALLSGAPLQAETAAPARPHSCSTFLLPAGGAFYVGHNLDDYYAVPGAVVVNPAGVRKESLSWEDDLYTVFGKSRRAPRVRWIAKYGSLTYNTQGRDFIDGGMNEVGLYVGEMTLRDTLRPPQGTRPQIEPRLWMQYLLDNFASVDEVIASLDAVAVGGPTTWHFFVADRQGETAAIEFLEGQAVIHRGAAMPVKALCNATYEAELTRLAQFQGFSGGAPLDMANKDPEADRRFAWAAALLAAYPAAGSPEPVAYAFDILDELNLGNNQWQVVYDLSHGRMYFRTARARQVRHVDLADFDLACPAPALMLDIHRDLAGDAASAFEPYSAARNREFVRRALAPLDLGVPKPLGEAFKGLWERRLHNHTRGFVCATEK